MGLLSLNWGDEELEIGYAASDGGAGDVGMRD
jgi:hypothetical protein